MREQRRTSSVSFRGAETNPLPWEEICREAAWQGRWVALDDCAYNEAGEATAGLVVDFDDNLSELCARMSADHRKRCSIVFCPPANRAA